MKPEMVGPIAGATEITIDTLPIVRPRLLAGTSVISVVISSGSMMAVPEAWITRATTRTSKPGAMAAVSVPSEKRLIAAMKIARVL